MSDHMRRLETLGRAGIIVSICYGMMGSSGEPAFSVTAMSATGEQFSNPFAANSFEHAIEIVETEALRRGWHPN
jgi:hypothetical protein